MRNFIVTLFFILVFTNLVVGQDWISIQLDENAKLSFSSKPEITNAGNKKIYQLVTEEYLMNVVVADLSNNPDFKVSPNDLSQFYEGIIKGSLDAAKDSKLLSKKSIKNGNIDGKEIIYTKDYSGIDDLKVIKQIYLVNKTIFIIEIWELTEDDISAIVDKYFNSLSIEK